jgi:Tfp pilus assembly protein PilF
MFLKGGHYLWKGDLEHSSKCYERAISLDPQYALPHSLLAANYVTVGIHGQRPAVEAMPLARFEAERALDLDPSLPEAQSQLASVYAIFDYNWKEAERRYELALSVDPVPTS